MPAGDKYLMYINETDSFHGLFGFNIGECLARGISPAKCDAFRSWLSSAAVAFLDAYLQGNLVARHWLDGAYLRYASQGVVEWQSK
jgi:hypothetical protein